MNKVVEPPKFNKKHSSKMNKSVFLPIFLGGKKTKCSTKNKNKKRPPKPPHLLNEKIVRFLFQKPSQFGTVGLGTVLGLWGPRQQFVLIPGLLPQVDSNPKALAFVANLAFG